MVYHRFGRECARRKANISPRLRMLGAEKYRWRTKEWNTHPSLLGRSIPLPEFLLPILPLHSKIGVLFHLGFVEAVYNWVLSLGHMYAFDLDRVRRVIANMSLSST